MTRLIVRLYGEKKVSDFETTYAAHHALMRSATGHGFEVSHDIDVAKHTMSGVFTRDDKSVGSWIIGEVVA